MSEPEIRHVAVRDVQFGARVNIVEPCNLYGCEIGDDCFIGPFTEIQKTVRIAARTRVQSHTFICELVTIGEDCFIGHGVMFVNDTFSAGGPAARAQGIVALHNDRKSCIDRIGRDDTSGKNLRRCRGRRGSRRDERYRSAWIVCRKPGANAYA